MRTAARVLCVVLAALAFSGAVGAAETPGTLSLTRTDVRRQKTTRAKILALARRWAKANPERAAQLLRGTGDGPTPVATAFRGNDGERHEAVLDGRSAVALSLGWTERKAHDRSNLLRVYTTLYDLLPAPYREGLRPPGAVRKLGGGRITKELVRLGTTLTKELLPIQDAISQTTPIAGLFVNPIGACDQEVGWESGGAQGETSARCEVLDYALGGIFRNVDWVLKPDLTCVKDQTRRGACAAHTIAANVESRLLINGGVPENLSEQNLYFWAKIVTDWANRYDDGLDGDAVYEALDAENYLIQYEANWNYNRSPARVNVLDPDNTYPNSCGAGYTGEMCTGYAFQAEEAAVGGVPLLYTYPAPSPTAGREITGWVSIPSFPGLPTFQIDTAVAALEAEIPIHLSVLVPDSFRNPDANGYVASQPGDVAGDGSHAILAVGFVGNADLPAAAPPDPDGIGYFVIKNSWGLEYADCGFGYLSHEWVRRWAYGFRYIDDTVL